MTLVGERVELEIGPVAHGGHCVARWDGRVVFVRHSLPGERVVAVVTEGEPTSRFLRADAVEVLAAAPGRVERRCPVSGPGGCGGCDFQHVDLSVQRRLLGDVVAEQLRRVAGIDRQIDVEPVGADTRRGRDAGLRWRTRVTFTADPEQRLGLHRHRSHEVIALDDCPIAHRDLLDVLGPRWPVERVTAVTASTGDRLVVAEGVHGRLPVVPTDGTVADGQRVRGRSYVKERVRHREFRVSAAAFWQVHPAAAEVLLDAVLTMTDVQPGEQVADLYAGVGLFTAFLAERAGADGAVLSVEGDPRASRDARRSLHDLANVTIVNGAVDEVLAARGRERHDVVVLDPPRTGARRRTVELVVDLRPSRVVHVACDPAALARDIGLFAAGGYVLRDLRAFDLFPMTQHVECVALLTPR